MKAISALLLLFMAASALQGESIRVTIAGATYATTHAHGSEAASKVLTLPANSNILDALAHAGGCSEAAMLSQVRLTRRIDETMTTFTFDVTHVLKAQENGFTLREGDVIFVPEIIEAYAAPHYFNRLLFEWAFLKATHQPLPDTWALRVNKMTSRGVEARAQRAPPNHNHPKATTAIQARATFSLPPRGGSSVIPLFFGNGPLAQWSEQGT